MSAATSSLQNARREEAQEMADRGLVLPEGVERLADQLTVWDARYGIRAVYLGRYGGPTAEEERVRLAVREARVALDELSEALRMNVRRLVDERQTQTAGHQNADQS